MPSGIHRRCGALVASKWNDKKLRERFARFTSNNNSEIKNQIKSSGRQAVLGKSQERHPVFAKWLENI